MSNDAGETAELLAPAKLTLSLRITGVREDGYHLIDAEMISVDLYDRLTIGPGDALDVRDAATGLAVGASTDNLVVRALRLAGRSAAIQLEKVIPAGAGLGGGSSDAAAVLRWCGFDDAVAAAGIGADVAFCLRGGRARVRGIGELVEPLPFEARTLTLLTPPFGVSTPTVYRRWDAMGGPSGEHGNDLEPAALAEFPELARWRDALSEAAGQRARLAGSGGTWFVDGAVDGLRVDGVSARVVRAVQGHLLRR